jgi:cell division protein FtsI/penicillin-binding protein 2
MERESIRRKANQVLRIIFIAFFLIAMRVWYLAIIAHEEHVKIARKPQIRTVIEQANRGTIRDRFNVPLAVNKIQYDVAVCYDPIRRLPRTEWRKNKDGQKFKVLFRQEYIEKLSDMLADFLGLHAKDIEDVIYSKAALFPNTPFTLKENISEEQFYRMKMLERKWPGLDLQITSRRYYPGEEIGASIIGYMGAINEREHLAIHNELEILEEFVKSREEGLPIALPKGFHSSLQVKNRLKELKDRSYTINSRVGKSGIEKTFDEDLRGFFGKKKYEVDIQGHYLRELPESFGFTPGRRLLLTISTELQALAESLLAQSEISREERFRMAGKGHESVSAPWIKGGAIVAMIPQTGEIVAMASYPRFNPNDFISKSSSLNKWLENISYIGNIWDGRLQLERDFSGALKPKHIQEKQPLTWEYFLSSILSKNSSVLRAMETISTVQNAISLQVCMDQLIHACASHTPLQIIDAIFPKDQLSVMKTEEKILKEIGSQLEEQKEYIHFIKKFLELIPHNDDKLLALDLCRLAVHHQLFDPSLIPHLENLTISEYRKVSQIVSNLKKEIYHHIKELFHLIDFPKWREQYFKSYLKEKREEEVREKRYQRPYLEYLEEMEEILFKNFLRENAHQFLMTFIQGCNTAAQTDPLYPYLLSLLQEKQKALNLKEEFSFLERHLNLFSSSAIDAYLQTIRGFDDLTRPLWGRYYLPSKPGRIPIEKDLARHFYPATGFGYARSYAFQETAPQGSIFKIVTSFEAMRQHYEATEETNPLTIIDECKNILDNSPSAILGYTSSGSPITRSYKGGRLPRTRKKLGKIDMLEAIEQSSNIYFSLLASEVIADPLDLNRASKKLGLGSKTGVALTGEAAGIIPLDVADNLSGLYSLAIGQHSLTVTPLQTASCIASFVNDGELLKPQIMRYIANIEPSLKSDSWVGSTHYSYEEFLNRIGIYFPFFTEAEVKQQTPYLWKMKKEPREKLFIPPEVKKTLFSGMYRVINGANGSGKTSGIRTLYEYPRMKTSYQEVKPSLIGKTGTAEILYRPCLDREYQPILCKHIWFGGASFNPKETDDLDELFKEPELVVVVYLRYGDYGKEAIPLAAEIIKKWREIKDS